MFDFSLPPNPSPISLGEKLRSALTAVVAIFFSGMLSAQFVDGGGLKTLLASMGASAVILFAVPSSPMAKLWPQVGGHFISASIGILCARHIAPVWWSASLAVGLSILAMHFTRCLHPPGGATSLIPVLGGESIQQLGFQFLLTPLALNVAVMALVSQLQNRLMKGAETQQPARQTPGHSQHGALRHPQRGSTGCAARSQCLRRYQRGGAKRHL